MRLADLPRLFTRPTWQNVLLLVAGAILAPGKRTVTPGFPNKPTGASLGALIFR